LHSFYQAKAFVKGKAANHQAECHDRQAKEPDMPKGGIYILELSEHGFRVYDFVSGGGPDNRPCM
jgi:hypothetical protein